MSTAGMEPVSLVPETVSTAGWLAWVEALRLRQWPKGLVVLVGLLPTGQFTDLRSVVFALSAAVLFHFCAASGYLVNDVVDARRDRLHPRKRSRSIASGRISRASALAVAAALCAGSLGAAGLLGGSLWLVLTVYILIALSYSLWLKHLVIADIVLIAVMFVLRAIAGVVAIGAEPSHLFLGSIGCLSLLLALGKRLHESELLSTPIHAHRNVLKHYRSDAWSIIFVLVAVLTVGCYAAAATWSPTATQHVHIAWTILPVAAGVLRYVHLVKFGREGGEPEALLARDRLMLASAIAWLAILVAAMLV